MTRINRLFITVLSVMSVFSAVNSSAQSLKFKNDGTFKIVQFTDVHWKPGNPASLEAERCMNAILDAEKPDMVVYTGDLAFAAPAREAVIRALKPTVDRGLPFAVTWGNHDDEYDASREELFSVIASLPGNLTDSVAGLFGVTNCVIPLQASNSDSTANLIYIIDSNGYSSIESARGYAGIQPDQIDWYRKSSKTWTEANDGKPLPAIAFFHVPLNEVNFAASNENSILNGTRRERACTPSVNSGMFSEILRCGDIMATFFGHDHINDYAVAHQGILLAYGRYTGGKTVYCDIPGDCGARVIILKEGKRQLASWIRLADGSVLNRINFPHDFTRWKASPNQ